MDAHRAIHASQPKTGNRLMVWIAGLMVSLEAWANRNASPRVQAFLRDNAAQGDPIKAIAVGFILIAISLVIALTILPTVSSAVNTAASDGNLTSTDATLLRLLPTLLIVGLLAGGVAFLFHGFKQIRAN